MLIGITCSTELWGAKRVPDPSCRLGLHLPQQETLLICPPKSLWLDPAVRTAGCPQPDLRCSPPGGTRVGDSGSY